MVEGRDYENEIWRSTNITTGLTNREAAGRLVKWGENALQGRKRKSPWLRFLAQFQDPLIYVLMVAAFVSALLREYGDSIIILIVILFNAAIGFVQEGKAQRALEALQSLILPKATVLRQGKVAQIDARRLVVGDVVLLSRGSQIPADIELAEAKDLSVMEAALTGEAIPVEKSKGRVYKNTYVTSGSGIGVVVATGMDTEIGKIAATLEEDGEQLTQLQKKLGELGKWLSLLSMLLCLVLFLVAILQGKEVLPMLLTAISLGVAAVPEGLPAVVTLCLAMAVTKMVRVNTVVRRLPTAEVLGSVDVVCTDKTGTLTENKMTIVKALINGRYQEGPALRSWSKEKEQLLLAGLLCNDSPWDTKQLGGNPTELAFYEWARACGLSIDRIKQQYPRLETKAFSSETKDMYTLHRCGAGSGEAVCYGKGALEVILPKCTEYCWSSQVKELDAAGRRKIETCHRQLAREGLRVLAIAMKNNCAKIQGSGYILLGLVGIMDPPREEAYGAVKRFQEAGVKTVMITGDSIETALTIGQRLGIAQREDQCVTGAQVEAYQKEDWDERLDGLRIFARVSPLQKLEIIRAYQERGSIVAMNGDGINDAPALKQADIGVAMGKNGTDVAKQAADMILLDDNYGTIGRAIEEGRNVYENIRKAVIFLLSSNLGELLTMVLAVCLGLPAPLLPCHILWINLITDSLPAFALGIDENDRELLMKQPPRTKKESIFARGGLLAICFYGSLIAALSLGAFFLVPVTMLQETSGGISLVAICELLKEELVLSQARTYSFIVLSIAQLFHGIGMRDLDTSLFRMKHFQNRLMILAVVLGIGLQILVTSHPFFLLQLKTYYCSSWDWYRLLPFFLGPLFFHEIFIFLGKNTLLREKKMV